MDPSISNDNLVLNSLPTLLHETKLAEHGTRLRMGLVTQKQGATQSRLPAQEKDSKKIKGGGGHAACAAQASKV